MQWLVETILSGQIFPLRHHRLFYCTCARQHIWTFGFFHISVYKTINLLVAENIVVLWSLQYLNCCSLESPSRKTPYVWPPRTPTVSCPRFPILWSCQRLQNKHQEDSKSSVYFCNFWGRKSLGKVSGQWNIWNEAGFAPPSVQPWGAHQEGSCESGILFFNTLYTFIKICGCAGERNTLAVNYARWQQLLHDVLGWSKGDGMETKSAMTKKPGDLISFLKPQWMHIRR